MIQDKFSSLIDEVVNDLNDQVNETVRDAYELGFKQGSESIKRYAVEVLNFDDIMVTDIIKQFTTIEAAQKYIQRVNANNLNAFLYEYNYVNDQYELVEN